MKILAIAAIALVLTILSVCHRQNDVVQWRGTNRDGIYHDKHLLKSWPSNGPMLIWRFDSLGIGYSSPVVTNNRIYTAGVIDSISYLFAFNLDGSINWKKKLSKDWMRTWPGIYCTPTICGDLGYITTGVGRLYCFNANNGEIIWYKNLLTKANVDSLRSGYLNNLIVDDNKVICIVGDKERNCLAIDRFNGKELWVSKGNGERDLYCSPILINHGGKKYFIYHTFKSLISVDASNGEVAWVYKRDKGSVIYTPTYRNGNILFPDYDKGSIMLKIADDGKSVSELWRNPNLQTHMGDAILLGDRVFGRGKKNMIYAVDWATGNELYSFKAKSMVTTIVSADEMLYCYDMDGDFYLLQPQKNQFEKKGNFKVLGGTKNHCSHPVIKNGRLYIRHDNSLFIYDIAKK